MTLLLGVVAAALVAILARGRTMTVLAPVSALVRRALESRWAPAVVGLLFAAAIWRTWGPGRPIADLHDEVAYLLQARLFAAGRWTASGPPMPEFFAQPHVLNDPLVASKYPPGHSLLLSLGYHLGSPALVVLLLGALRAGVTFALARRLTNGAVALATVVLLMHGQSLYFAASFFSETTTAALLVVAWYALHRWCTAGEHRARWMALLALAVGWCAITRPFSAVLFALPIGLAVLRDVRSTHRWRDLGIGVALGCSLLAVLPLWSQRTTGSWRLWPVTVYTRDYMPFDRPHFGYDPTPPRKTPPPDLAFVNASLDSLQRMHTIDAVPSIALARWGYLARQSWWHPVSEGGLALLGLAIAPAAALVGAATALVVFVGYLAHPTWPDWTIYYMELAPVFAFFTACGLALVLRLLAREPEREWAWARTPAAAMALLVAIVFTVPMLRTEIRYDRMQHTRNVVYQRQFRDGVRRLPPSSLLFVRHAKWHEADRSLVTNDADFATSRTWIAYDRGDSANASLMRLIPGRQAFLFDEGRHTINIYPSQPLATR